MDDNFVNLDSSKFKCDESFLLCDTKFKSTLLIQDGYIKINFLKEKPNFWWRFWYWALLGWKWEDIKGKINE
jgi:hypothetical protein